jgi:hypothetical protein
MSILLADPLVSHEKLRQFLQRWPIKVIEKLTLQEYSTVRNRDTFTYWLEFGSQELGRIGGGGTFSSMFGIWNRDNDTEKHSRDYLTDGEYKWSKDLGEDPETAFLNVRTKILEIINHALSGNFHFIDGIKLHSFVRWKIAFIYSDYALLPIYKKDILMAIACHLDHDQYHKAPLSELHTFILSQLPSNQDFFDFSSTCYQIGYAILNATVSRNYYIIGSKYGSNVDVLPDLLERSVISTGFLWGHDLTDLVGMGPIAFNKYAEKHIPANLEYRHASVKTLRRFVNLKAGDLVAVKSVGSFSRLTIVAYAVVKEVDGSVYACNDDNLGHLIHVDFIESGLDIKTELNYAETMHQIIPGQRPGHFELIFGSYALQDPNMSDELDEDEEENGPFDSEDENSDIREKDDSNLRRAVVAKNQVVTQAHNSLQNAFARYLRAAFPEDIIKTERSRIDIWRKGATGFYIYELKPYHTAYACIRAALGQLMDYAFSLTPSLKTHLIVVGPAEPGKRDLKYIEFLSDNLGLQFNYIYFDMAKKKAEEYG